MTIGPRNSKPMVALVVTLLCLSSFLPLVPAASAAGGGQYPTSILSVDGHGVSAGGCNPGAGGTCSIPITTSEPYDVIVFFTQCNTGVPVGSATPSDTGSLTWSARYAFAAVGGRNQGEYWAYAPGPLSSDTLTVTFSAAQSNCRIHWFGISGANTASPFDTNGAEPAGVNANSPASCTMTTTGSNDILFGEVGQGGTGYTSSPTGWTLLDVTGYGFQSALSYEIVSAKVTAQAETWTFIAGSNVSGLCDAIQQASDGLGYTVVTAATSGSSTVINPVIKNDWLVVVVGLEGIGQHVSSVTDTASSTFSKVGSSATDDDIETWCGRYTASTGGDVVTVTASSSASFSFRVVDVSSVTSCTADSVVAAHGNALDPVIPSTTLTAGDVCFASISYQSGTAGISWELNSPAGQPWVTYLGGNGVTTRPDSVDTSGNYYVADTEKAGWASGTSTTAQFTSSGASAVGWDELVVCLPTNPLSAGAQGQRGTSDASSASQSFQWYNPTTGGEYVLAEIAIPGTGVTVSGISSASPSVAWTKIGSSDTREDVEIWGALLTGGYQTFTATASLSGAAVMEANVIVVDDLAGTANVWTTKTASGTSASASVTSFTPTTNDFCVQATNFNAGATTAATTGSSPFQSAYPVQQSGSATRYLWTAYRDDWYSTLGPTTATITPALTSSPDWDEIVACLPAVTVSQPVKLTVANGGATGIFAASGCDTDTGSVTGDGSAHTIHVAASCPVTLTAPADGANTRERFNVAGNPSTTTTFSSCAGGVCPEQDSTYYDQLQNTYQASPSNPSTWDTSTGAVTATGTSVGSAGLTICTTGPPSSGSGTAISCAGWADYNTAVSMGNLVVGASERWAPSTASYSDTTGGNTHSDGYVDQFLVTVRAVPAGAGTTNPASGNDWMNFGSDPISASPNPGSAFITWSEIGPILIAAPGTASTTASISGPGTLTASFSTLVSDGYTFSDGTSRTLSFARAESDAIATADSVARTLGLGRAASDGFAFLESILGNSVFSRSVSDSLAFSDSATAIPQLYRGALDTFSLLDAAATGSSLLRTVADTFALADSPTGKVAIAISVTDAYLLLEGASAQTGITRATGDSISYTDGVLRVVSSQLTAADSFLLSEASFALPNLFRSASDSFGLTDGSGRLVRAFASIGDFLSLGETLGSLKVNAPTIIIASVGDAYTFSESLLKQTVLDRLASDVFVIGDNAQRAIDLVRSATDLFSVATGASQLVSLTRSVVDLYSLGAVSARTLSAYASVTDAVGVLEKVAGTLVTMVVGSSSSSSSSTSSGASAPNGLPSQIPAIVLLALIAIAALALVPILYRRRRTESDAQDAFTGD